MSKNSITIRKAKRQLKDDPEISKLMVPCRWDEIMFDLNGDGAGDTCLSSDNLQGRIDTLSFDITGNGEFNLYLHDSDGNGVPDTVLWAGDNSDQLEVIATGADVERGLIDIASRMEGLLTAEEFLNAEVGVTLADLAAYMSKNSDKLLEEVQRRIHAEGLEKVYYFLNDVGTYYLATAEGDQPRVRPFGTILLFGGKLYIQTGKVKAVSKQLAANPKAEICAFKDGTWLRVSGELINDDSSSVKEAMLDKYPSLKAMYSADDDNTQVLCFRNATAVFSSFSAPPETIEF